VTLALFDDRLLNQSFEHFYNQSDGLLVHWDASTDELVFTFPAQDVSAYTYLHFRASQRPGHALNTLDTFKDFKVQMADGGGATASVAIKSYQGGLQYPDLSGSLGSTDPLNYKAIMRSFRIPLADFASVALGNVTEIRFRFDRPDEAGFKNTTGAIAIDDVEFSK
jgi:hypothetical protein